MPIDYNEEDGGKLLSVHVSGKVMATDFEHIAPEFDRLVGAHERLRVLFDMRGLTGWEPRAIWEDAKFGVKHFADIERIAIVGEKEWHHRMVAFCKPFTRATLRYFEQGAADKARLWLTEAPVPKQSA
jgi:hypothetical protein